MNELKLDLGDGRAVSALLLRPEGAKALYLLAHGAGAGMRHSFMEAISTALADQKIATLRYQFPYTDAGKRRPDPPALLEATVRAAATKAHALCPDLPLLAGGKSMGGRMTSQAQAKEPLPHVRALVFLGFPLHAAGKPPSTTRGVHLAQVKVPMLFVQGERDKLADLTLLRPLLSSLPSATLEVVPEADHGFSVPKRTGRTPSDIISSLATLIATWTQALQIERT